MSDVNYVTEGDTCPICKNARVMFRHVSHSDPHKMGLFCADGCGGMWDDEGNPTDAFCVICGYEPMGILHMTDVGILVCERCL